MAVFLPLAQAAVAPCAKHRRQLAVHPAQQRVGGKQHEGASVGGEDAALGELGDHFGVAGPARFGNVGGDGHQGLTGEVEGGVEQ